MFDGDTVAEGATRNFRLTAVDGSGTPIAPGGMDDERVETR